ncbi:LAFE_0C12530g1_1 [Lachancea fermentati]|uniref:LAFE_0C12530g1_1 n=1 Tax=Lachancea fermentati TaxID=4955 RepID=A0A1G4MAF8_LACFM|nr:LAFE_0C12530g1_1 [Lachancea fermentati]
MESNSSGAFGIGRSLVSDYMAKKYDKTLESILANDLKGDRKKVSNRELIHGVASSLLEATIERVKASKETDRLSIDEDFEQYMLASRSESSDSFWKDENFRQDYELSVDAEHGDSVPEKKSKPASSKPKRTGDHFIDILLDKMISRILPEDFPEREQFSQRVGDPTRRKSQKLSATVFAANLKILTTKLGGVFEFQDSVVRVITWRNPSATVTMLIFLTIICFNPMYVVIIPLLYVLYGLMTPGYIHRHPMRRSAYLSRRTYGKSLIESLASGGKKTEWHSSDSIQEYEYNTDMKQYDINRAHHIKQSMEFVVNLRDLQNSMSAIVKLSDNIEKFIYGTAGFKDEHRSTALFLAGLLSLLFLWLVAPFINWSLVSSMGLWIIMIATHPKVRPKLSRIIKKEQLDNSKKALLKTERYDIILDEPPETKTAEIFEIYKQGITPKIWHFYTYSTSVFDQSDSFRKAQIPPPGVDDLKLISPPTTYSFENNEQWKIDYDVESWATERGLDLTIEGEFLVDDLFKRRRLIRKVMRYANPARKPSYR